MRHVLVMLLALGSAASAAAQEIKGKEEKKESMAPITEIGGKGLEAWIKEIDSTDPGRRELAMRTVLQFGPQQAYQAVPTIIARLKKHTPARPIDLGTRVSGSIALGVA